ncbi:MAG: hypothetical protein WCI73_19785, partial [Phycisphaerae bacterium]
AIPVEAADRAKVCEKLQAIGVDPARPFAVFSGGGKTIAQQWPLERYAQVLARLAQEFSLPVLALGTVAETERYRAGVLPGYPALRMVNLLFPSANCLKCAGWRPCIWAMTPVPCTWRRPWTVQRRP